MRDSYLQGVVRDERIGITVHALKSRSKNRLGDGQCSNGGTETKNHFALVHQIWQTACVPETNCFSPARRCCAAAFAAPPHFVSCLHQRQADSLPHSAGVKQPHCTTHSRSGASLRNIIATNTFWIIKLCGALPRRSALQQSCDSPTNDFDSSHMGQSEEHFVRADAMRMEEREGGAFFQNPACRFPTTLFQLFVRKIAVINLKIYTPSLVFSA